MTRFGPCAAAFVLAGCVAVDAAPPAARANDRVTFRLSNRLVYRGVVLDIGEPVAGFRAASGPLDGREGFFTAITSEDGSFVTIVLPKKVIEVTFDRRRKVIAKRELARDNQRRCALAGATAGAAGEPCGTYCAGLADAVSGDTAMSEVACAGVPSPAAPFAEIDVAVVYTNGVRSAVGDRGAISRIATAIEWTNIAFRRSGVRAMVRPARTPLGRPCIRHIPYNEASSVFTEILDIVLADYDLDDLPTYRNTCRADILVMVGVNYDRSGIACRMIRLSPKHADYAFAVVDLADMSTNYVFTHELGHLFGAGHAATSSCRTGVCSYSEAAVFSAGGGTFETVVGDTAVDNVLYFSGPAVFYDGTTVPTGSATADNARTLNIAAPVVAGFR